MNDEALKTKRKTEKALNEDLNLHGASKFNKIPDSKETIISNRSLDKLSSYKEKKIVNPITSIPHLEKLSYEYKLAKLDAKSHTALKGDSESFVSKTMMKSRSVISWNKDEMVTNSSPNEFSQRYKASLLGGKSLNLKEPLRTAAISKESNKSPLSDHSKLRQW